MTTANAIWFSRHRPTVDQLREIAVIGREIVALDAGMALGNRNLQDDCDVKQVIADLKALVRDHNAGAIYGVFPAPVQEAIVNGVEGYAGWITSFSACRYFAENAGVPCYAAWNVMRAVEGEKPSFSHQRFCYVGRIKAGKP